MKRAAALFLSLILVLTLASCVQPVSAAELKSDKPRQTSPVVSQSDLDDLVKGNSAFSFNLYQLLKEKDGNLFYSSYSISQALAMTYGGARAQTEMEMAAAMQFLLAQGQLHPAFNKLDMELAKRGQGAKGQDEKGFRLKVVNAIWGQKDFKFLSAYLDLLAENYGAGLRIVDYIKSPEPSRQIINQWVSEQTEGKIKDLLPTGAINELTRLVLTNAIYFNAAWASQFRKESTVEGKFTLLNNSQVSAAMMKQRHSFPYAEGDSYQAVQLPYDGGELAMIILLPKAGQFKIFETGLDNQKVSQIIQSLKVNEVDLTMPKFKIEAELGLKQTLSQLGMRVAFDAAQADFSGMDGAKDLYITDVVHKAYVSVDENGTEAAAATGVIVGTTGMPAEIKTMSIDRPFVFLIRDIKTGSVLFVGRVMNPA